MSQYMQICNILKFVADSAAESETGGCFMTGRDVIILRNTLQEIGHPQPITQVCTDNTTAVEIENNKIKQQQSLAMNIQYF